MIKIVIIKQQSEKERRRKSRNQSLNNSARLFASCGETRGEGLQHLPLSQDSGRKGNLLPLQQLLIQRMPGSEKKEEHKQIDGKAEELHFSNSISRVAFASLNNLFPRDDKQKKIEPHLCVRDKYKKGGVSIVLYQDNTELR